MNTKKLLITIVLVGTISAAPAMAMSSKVKPPVADSVSVWYQPALNFFSF